MDSNSIVSTNVSSQTYVGLERVRSQEEIEMQTAKNRQRLINEKLEKEAEEQAHLAKQYRMALQTLRECQFSNKEAHDLANKTDVSVAIAEASIAKILEKYTPSAPAAEPTLPVYAVSNTPITTPAQRQIQEDMAELHRRPEDVPCPICRMPTLPGIAYHTIISGGSELCIVDAARAIKAGLPRERVMNLVYEQQLRATERSKS